MVKRAGWISRTGRDERGLFCKSEKVEKGSFVATFGPVSRSRKDAKQMGYEIAVRCRVPGQHSARTVMVAPKPDWEECQFMGPMINHTCCVRHVNCGRVQQIVDDIDISALLARAMGVPLCHHLVTGGPEERIELDNCNHPVVRLGST